MKNDNNDADNDAFDDLDPPAQPFWKRELIMGLNLPWLAGILLLLAAAFWYKFLRQPDGAAAPAYAQAEAWEPAASPPPASDLTSSSQAPQPDMTVLLGEVRAELDRREQRLNDSLKVVQDSVSRLADTIRKDEAYAQDTRRALEALEVEVSALNAARPAAPAGAKKPAVKKASPVAGMKIASLESGMAWIRWQNSTWAVRVGEPIGKVTVTGIDTASRTVTTTGGTIR